MKNMEYKYREVYHDSNVVVKLNTHSINKRYSFKYIGFMI